MTEIDSQTLMAYIDGELDAPERQRVEQALEQHPELQQQMGRLCQLNAMVSVACSDALHTAQPPLRALQPQSDASTIKSKFWHGAGLLMNWQVGAAAAILVMGVMTGSWYQSYSQQAELDITQQLLQDAINNALETNLSSVPYQWISNGDRQQSSITPLRTYKSKQGQYCREFIERHNVAGRITEQRGIACRNDDGWELKANFML